MSPCLFELVVLGLGELRVGRLGRLRFLHAPQSLNLSRVCGTRNPTFGAPGRGALDTLCLVRQIGPPAPMASAPPSTRLTRASEEAPGLCCFTLSLRWVEWPPKFRPKMLPRYNGAEDPAAFLHAYEEEVWADGKEDKVKANWLPMALVGAPRA